MHTRRSTFSNDTIISNLNSTVESILKEIQLLQLSRIDICDADSFEKLEIEIHAKTKKLADTLSAMKLQEALNSNELNDAEKDLLKSHPSKMKNMGRRTVTIRMLGGTLVHVEVTYYHQKSDTKSRSRKGFYPKLLLLGIHDKCTPALSSRVSLFATAACSFEEAKRLMETLYGFKLDIKTICMICKRFAFRIKFFLLIDWYNMNIHRYYFKL